MSASPIARQACSHSQVIPSKRILVTDATQLPDVYSSTPGGTLYSTTPGGRFSIIIKYSKIKIKFFIWFHLNLIAIIKRVLKIRNLVLW